MYQWLDRAPKGRNENGPWWRRHDESRLPIRTAAANDAAPAGERCPGKGDDLQPGGLENLEETGRLLAPARRKRRGQIPHRVFTGRPS